MTSPSRRGHSASIDPEQHETVLNDVGSEVFPANTSSSTTYPPSTVRPSISAGAAGRHADNAGVRCAFVTLAQQFEVLLLDQAGILLCGARGCGMSRRRAQVRKQN